MSDFLPLGDIIAKKTTKKAPAHQWQDLALRVIGELNIPAFKRGSVFKVCRDHSRGFVENCLNTTKELCPAGEKWRYFFKLVDELAKLQKPPQA